MLTPDDDHEACERRASAAAYTAEARIVASARHVWAECEAVACARDTAAVEAEAAASCRAAQRLVAAAGGRASVLMHLMGEAEAYLRASVTARRAMPDSAFAAYRRIVAGDLPRPDWRLTSRGDDDEEERAVRELAKELATIAVGVGDCCAAARRTWQERAGAEVTRREAFERGRGTLRLCMRAWREQADARLPASERAWRARSDGRRAGANDWERRWTQACAHRTAALQQRRAAGGLAAAELDELARLERHLAALGGGQQSGAGGAGSSSDGGDDCALARRTEIPDGALRLWEDKSWRVRWILEWYRLVRAGAVLARRRRPQPPGSRQPRHSAPPPQHGAHASPSTSANDRVRGPMGDARDDAHLLVTDGASDSDDADGHAARGGGPRARRTDAVLVLGRAARGGLARQLTGRLAHARGARGDG